MDDTIVSTDEKMQAKCELWRRNGRWVMRVNAPQWVLAELCAPNTELKLVAQGGGPQSGHSATYEAIVQVQESDGTR